MPHKAPVWKVGVLRMGALSGQGAASAGRFRTRFQDGQDVDPAGCRELSRKGSLPHRSQGGTLPIQAADRASHAQLPACYRRVRYGWVPAGPLSGIDAATSDIRFAAKAWPIAEWLVWIDGRLEADRRRCRCWSVVDPKPKFAPSPANG
jgi:hypothetical protein